MRLKLLAALVPVFAVALLITSSTARADCEICHDLQGVCGDGINSRCYAGENPDRSPFCADDPDNFCGGFTSIDRIDAAGLPASRVATNLVAPDVGHVTRPCDDAVLQFQFNAEDAATLRAASATIVI